MGESINIAEFTFSRVIDTADTVSPETFRDFAFVALGDDLSDPVVFGIATALLIAGLQFCDEYDPGLYYEFLHGASHAVIDTESHRVCEAGMEYGPMDAEEFPSNVFFDYAETMLNADAPRDERSRRVRGLAWAMVQTSLEFCEEWSVSCYPKFVLTAGSLIVEEIRRVRDDPKLALTRHS